ncbi:MAG: hypothetical protein IH846_15435, partial [Acidobacteria bacterium]|nr:hypothetical protein [Acidobacteriota bacterium]
FIFLFASGLIIGYFVERSGIVYTQSEIDKLRLEIENAQIQEMFISGAEVDCKLLFSSMGKLSFDLYTLVNSLQAQSPGSPEFEDAKVEADLLSLRAWILARNARSTCTGDLLPILFLYSGDCETCPQQDAILQQLKIRYENVLVYAIDADSQETSVKLVKDAYEIPGPPALLINNELHGFLNAQDLETIICEQITCA